MTLMMMWFLQQSHWAELEFVFSSFANSVFQSFVEFSKRIKRFAADIKFLCSSFLLANLMLGNYTH